MLRIEIEPDRETATLRLSGRIQSDHINELRRHAAAGKRPVVFDLSEVTLVDLGVVKFLRVCEDLGTDLRHCSRYIREWICRERAEDSGAEERAIAQTPACGLVGDRC